MNEELIMHSNKNNKAYIYASAKLPHTLIPYNYWLQVYMIAAIFSNLILLFCFNLSYF